MTTGIKLILVRHGIALHNVIQQQPYPTTRTPCQQGLNNNINDDEDLLFDPSLTIEGKKQAIMIGETIRGFIRLPEQLTSVRPQPTYQILTSPLTRCLQTTMYLVRPINPQHQGLKLFVTRAYVKLVAYTIAIVVGQRRNYKHTGVDLSTLWIIW
jgi:broad specificity phosphatase PhoE